jgi:hypothetical protein
MPSTCLRLRVDQLLERTWVSSTDQAPANRPSSLASEQNKSERSEQSEDRSSSATIVMPLGARCRPRLSGMYVASDIHCREWQEKTSPSSGCVAR